MMDYNTIFTLLINHVNLSNDWNCFFCIGMMALHNVGVAF